MLAIMIVHVCWEDGQRVGEFEEADFRDKIFAGELQPDNFYWYEGMAEWRPISEYRALAKTQRIVIEATPLTEMIPNQPAIARSPGSEMLARGAIIGIIGVILLAAGVASGSRVIGGLGALILLAGVALAVVGRLRP